MVKDFVNGLWGENPIFRAVIGICSALAVTTAGQNGIAMGLALTFVLTCSSILVSILKNIIPSKVRIPCYIIVIATFTTIVDLFMKAYFPALYQVMGIFIPLIVVNCIVLWRAEGFASKMSLIRSIADALGMGLGYAWAITLISIVREILGSGTLFGIHIMGANFTHWVIMLLPPGAFLVMGILVGIMNMITRKPVKNTHCH
ncbi:MAG TPA: electron transport complex subunit E [Thermoanaerobacterales bacterium]|jgi:electron transport complex protein RnfE|uniref:Ion-translocating oxidoreductase complex subunit E n=1 Tax=Biomaibacter acetigenes TaxID=2316383 RepID=A0A3G2R6E8_9FIRM|nr:electron transport complex subunit E [Biomaibacter acetigenes]AYO31022.1 RnfABCDGE type electron transport complex subunit E [Biomaibacter acetigenes]RKL63905.1 electron transport complex subunit E [Thermoanaerobacteraceae bacterium SP2]HHW01635.1 electron transport complex subunit E [Thermoanaerobacterales bacterium]